MNDKAAENDMHAMLPSEWIYRFVAYVRERDPALAPKDAVSMARAAAEVGQWRVHLPEEVAARALGEVGGGQKAQTFEETEPAVFGLMHC